MNQPKRIVLDANILIRFVLGERVRNLLLDHVERAHFLTPDVCLQDARRHLPQILVRRGVPSEGVREATEILDLCESVVRSVSESIYRDARDDALERIKTRDAADWPILALALVMDCPVWTEDRDFFGSGVATWTTDRVNLYLRGQDFDGPK